MIAASIEEVAYEIRGPPGIVIIGSMSALVYTLAMKLSAGLQVPDRVRDSLDEVLLTVEGLPAQAAEVLKTAGRTPFDQSFYTILAESILFVVIAAAIVGFVGAKSKKRETAIHS
ncbi:hypothetical protein B4V02_04425 [Paenibacillus kribbensis]|uniref:Uncharacterized protein n=1 Tax=Paenibacillus kribbensis TaxID=172713 RepID=A0A222WIQ1_9BACL|nr:hypothetical protein B4V02_04425 [Paenibacillus kribbensis]